MNCVIVFRIYTNVYYFNGAIFAHTVCSLIKKSITDLLFADENPIMIMEINHNVVAPLNILYAEDDLDDRNLFEKVLNLIPIPIKHKIVKNGELLMHYLRTTEDPLPDVVFLDLSMPLKTGFECLAEIKDDDKLKALYVVMLTASFTRGTELEDILKSTLEGMGAMHYIRKTGNLVQFKAILQPLLKSIVLNKTG